MRLDTLRITTKMYSGVIAVVLCTIMFLSGIVAWRTQRTLDKMGHDNLAGFMDAMCDVAAMQDRIGGEALHNSLEALASSLMGQGELHLSATGKSEHEVVDQTSGAKSRVAVPDFELSSDGMPLPFSPNTLVEKHKRSVGSDATLFALLPGKLLRVATTITDAQGKRAIDTYIPESSPVYKAIASGSDYTGRATVMGHAYRTHYRPVKDAYGTVIGALFVGEPLLSEAFRTMFGQAKVGGRGYTFIFTPDGTRALHPTRTGTNILQDSYGKQMLETRNGFLEWEYQGHKVGFVRYFEPWDLYLAVAMTRDEMLQGADTDMLRWTAGGGVAALALAVLFVWVLVRELMKPMGQLAAYARTVAGGDFSAVMHYAARDAVGDTIAAVNAMVAEMKNKLGFTQGVLNGMTVPFAISSPDEKVVFTNEALVKLLERPGAPADWMGKPLDRFVYGRTMDDMATRRCLQHGNAECNLNVDLTTETGKTVHAQVDVAPLYDLDGTLIGAFTIYADVTGLRTQQARTEAQHAAITRVAEQADAIARQLATAAEELARQVDEANGGADRQRARTAETATAMEQMNASMLEVASNASQAAGNAEGARAKADEGEHLVADVVQAITGVRDLAVDLRANMEGLGRQAEDIGRVMQVIEDIADQTNLLALNAAIEAARAGDAGLRRGGRRGAQAGRKDHGGHPRGGPGHRLHPDRRARQRAGHGVSRGCGDALHRTHRKVRRHAEGDSEHGGPDRRPGALHRHRVGAAVRSQRADQPVHRRGEHDRAGHGGDHVPLGLGRDGTGRTGRGPAQAHRRDARLTGAAATFRLPATRKGDATWRPPFMFLAETGRQAGPWPRPQGSASYPTSARTGTLEPATRTRDARTSLPSAILPKSQMEVPCVPNVSCSSVCTTLPAARWPRPSCACTAGKPSGWRARGWSPARSTRWRWKPCARWASTSRGPSPAPCSTCFAKAACTTTSSPCAPKANRSAPCSPAWSVAITGPSMTPPRSPAATRSGGLPSAPSATPSRPA
jgi:methyl-accepting chemotaxis protein